MNNKEIKKYTEEVLIHEIEYYKRNRPNELINFLKSLDSEDKKAINVFLKNKGYWERIK